jgi:hypothetical protein
VILARRPFGRERLPSDRLLEGRELAAALVDEHEAGVPRLRLAGLDPLDRDGLFRHGRVDSRRRAD